MKFFKARNENVVRYRYQNTRKQLWCSQTLRCSNFLLPTEEEESVDRHKVILSFTAFITSSCSWSNQQMKFQGSFESPYPFHRLCTRLCTQLVIYGVAAFCSYFSSAIVSRTEANIEEGILLAM